MKHLIISAVICMLVCCSTQYADPTNYINCDKEKYDEWIKKCTNDGKLTVYGCDIIGRRMFCDYKFGDIKE